MEHPQEQEQKRGRGRPRKYHGTDKERESQKNKDCYRRRKELVDFVKKNPELYEKFKSETNKK